MTGRRETLSRLQARHEAPALLSLWRAPWGGPRGERTVDCPGCGVTIQPIDDTPIGVVQKLIDETRGDA